MKVHLGVALAALITGCGDNSKECGPGTTDEAGICTPVASCGTGTVDDGTGLCVPDGNVVCAKGTIFDAASGTCQIDPSACQDGTVPIGGACVDPASGLTVDVEEGAEPNGFGVLGEPSSSPAGLVALKASGTTVIHGKIVPADHDGDGRLDADIDTYQFTVLAPTYVHVAAVGVHGLDAGFTVFAKVAGAGVDPVALAQWQRFGINLAGGTAKRDLYIPAAGTYLLAITDSRTLVLGAPAAGADPNAPAFEYFVSLTAQLLPQPTPLALVNDSVIVTGMLDPGAIRLYTLAETKGSDDVKLEAPPDTFGPDDGVNASVVVLDNNKLRSVGTEHQSAGLPVAAEVIVPGIAAGDTTLVVVDTELDWELDPTPFRLTIKTM